MDKQLDRNDLSNGENGMNAMLDQVQSSLLNASNESFWRALNPDLHISPFPLSGDALFSKTDTSVVEQCTSRMVKEGYFQVPPVISREKAGRLARVVADLKQKNIAPVFAFVYDEFWQVFTGVNPVLHSLLGGGYQITPSDIWIWHIDKSAAAAGWGPHRDLPHKDSVRDDNTPRVITVWIPLTDTTPLNACMYVLPSNLDPNIPDNIGATSFTLRDWQNIRALPAEAGEALGWNSQVLHWGGRSSEWAEQPRISVGIYLQSQDCDLNKLYKDPCREGLTPLTFDKTFELPFNARLRAIARAITMYRQMVRIDFPATWQDLFRFAEEHYNI